MELAGQGVAYCIEDLLKTNETQKPIIVFCGPGNNGGDGMVASWHLIQKIPSLKIDVFYFKDYKDHLKDCFDRLTNYDNIRLKKWDDDLESFKEYGLIVDSIFGFSFKGPLREEYKNLFELLNKTKTPRVSVDVPSGWEIDGDNTNKPYTPDYNISLSNVKSCMESFSGKHYLVNYFVPPKLYQELKLDYEIEKNNFFKII